MDDNACSDGGKKREESVKRSDVIRRTVVISGDIVVEQHFNEFDMGKNHATATVSRQVELVHCFPFGMVCFHQLEIVFPFVANDFPAGEAADWDDHCDSVVLMFRCS